MEDEYIKNLISTNSFSELTKLLERGYCPNRLARELIFLDAYKILVPFVNHGYISINNIELLEYIYAKNPNFFRQICTKVTDKIVTKRLLEKCILGEDIDSVKLLTKSGAEFNESLLIVTKNGELVDELLNSMKHVSISTVEDVLKGGKKDLMKKMCDKNFPLSEEECAKLESLCKE